ncbi:unnamed protein product [Lathyrus sativus]|nr:unnamed protein product [Lathyrus sativus]
MNCITYNIRGGGTSTKRRRIRETINKGKTDICFIQETKRQNMTEEFVKSFWGVDRCEWSATPSIGQSGGLITIWRLDMMKHVSSLCGKGFLGINMVWKELNCHLTNVYSNPYLVCVEPCVFVSNSR